MIQMIVTYCTCDDLPIDVSPAYASILRQHGQEIADRLTYELPTRPPPGERDPPCTI